MPADAHHPAEPGAEGPRVNATRARQGRFGLHVFWILIVSTVLAALALFGAWSFRANDFAAVEHNTGATTPAEAQAGNTPQQPARQTP
ncbi:hypothetical protein [Caulobacter sp. BP25]|uniref:hypothetical protein n=1 Tax=Caulobacter sp. BP25 TaxID=2048900 RepID=UPI000C12C3B6|nr:hypothetical protein [Caulobacter sp. BP25]PHY19098.1 hypothetical protein CSW59_11805 [Caulobacter sp. BP25]